MTENKERSSSLVSFSYGPQHPGTHPYSLLLTVDGDRIEKVEAQIGYVHRGLAKQAESRTFIQALPIMERSCFIDSVNHQFGYVMAVEKLASIEVPERAEYLRVIAAELSRMNSLISWFGGYAAETGINSAFMWAWKDREMFLDLFGHLAGSRVSVMYLTIGGVRWDWNDKLTNLTWEIIDYMEERLKIHKKLVMKNSIFKKRTKGVGVVSKEKALEYAFTGPNLRASGVQGDIRILEPYSVYDHFKFTPKVMTEGDNWARTMIRLHDIETSMEILKQALPEIPEGEYKTKVPLKLRANAGEAYARVELSRGVMGYYIRTVEDKSTKPYRVKIRGPSFSHFQIVEDILVGTHMADIPIIKGSLDVCPADLDR
ncbi:MAG: NADH-quinone oxidoreductase subunit D [Candidatus Heimdallarchaeaceae archaeon]